MPGAKGMQDNNAAGHDESTTRLHTKLRREFGRAFLDALEDPKTVEILLNADGRLWQERLGEDMHEIGTMAAAQAEGAMRTIANMLRTQITAENPILEGELPLDGSRFAGWIPPVVTAPCFAVRKKASSIFTFEQYVAQGTMTEAQKSALVEAVTDHLNILVIGGTGSGKTTLCNAIIHEMTRQFPDERIAIIEDTGEIQCAATNALLFNTSLHASMTDLLKTTLRARPDRILVGEVRGAEALDLLDAWNTGHEGGIATLHANNAASGLDRLRSLVTRNRYAPSDIEMLIGEAVHVVVHIARSDKGRLVKEILRVRGYKDGRYQLTQL